MVQHNGTDRRAARSRLALSAALLAACANDAPDTAPDAAPAADIEAVAPAEFAPAVISDERWQYRITFTPDGRTAYFAVADAFFPQSRRATIHRSTLSSDGTWSRPEVASFSGTWPDMDPFITVDGGRLYFSSIRPANGQPKADLDLFYVDRVPGGWGEPVRLGPEVNTDLDELYASLDAAGNLYFASGPLAPTPDANWNIYSAAPLPDGGFRARAPVEAVNIRLPWDPATPTHDWQFNPEVSADGRILLFTSLRSGGHGFGDLYVSQREDGGWRAPVNLGPPVNTADDEFHPTLSRDGLTLYFARTILAPATVPGSFYSVPTSAIEVLHR